MTGMTGVMNRRIRVPFNATLLHTPVPNLTITHVILRERMRTHVSSREPKDLPVLGQYALKAILVKSSFLLRGGLFSTQAPSAAKR